MTEHSLWRFARALHRAINERQSEDLETLIDDDIDWAIFGPIASGSGSLWSMIRTRSASLKYRWYCCTRARVNDRLNSVRRGPPKSSSRPPT